MDFDAESPWDSDPSLTQDAEWMKISTEFTNSGYREGITLGKESALQEGFDSGFAHIGAPIGRELGLLRGLASALISIASQNSKHNITTAREISSQLANIRLNDIAPRDLEAEVHAREHLQEEADANPNSDLMEINEDQEVEQKRKMEGIEDMLNSLTAGESANSAKRPTIEDVAILKQRLLALSAEMGLQLNVNWS